LSRFRHRLSRRGRDHEGGPQRSRAQYRRDALVLGRRRRRSGAGLVAEAALLTFFVIAGNTLLRPLVNSINRIPIDEETSEATLRGSLVRESGSGGRGARSAH
jgi:hypothetical protein